MPTSSMMPTSGSHAIFAWGNKPPASTVLSSRLGEGGVGVKAWAPVLVVLLASPLLAQNVAVDGIFITVQNPITSEVMHRVIEATHRALQRFQPGAAPGGTRRVLKIVYDFNPDNRPSSTRDFGPCHDLAKFLVRLQDAHTVAFVHNEVTQHTVLPVLACNDIVMSSDAKLGAVTRDLKGEPLPRSETEAYKEAVKDRRCPAVVLKMLDESMEVLRVKKLHESGDWYIDQREAPHAARDGLRVLDPTPVLGRGPHTTLYTTAEAERFGLCVLRKESRQEVAAAYHLPPTSLREDPLLGRNAVACLIEVRSPITEALAETLRRRIRRAIAQRANLLILQLDCNGGDTQVASDLAEFLRTRKDDQGQLPIMTVAYIPQRAPDTAVFLALGCTEIVMRKEATIGDFSSIIYEQRQGERLDVEPARYQAKQKTLEELARAQGYPTLLIQGMFDRSLTLYYVRHRHTGEWTIISGDQLAQDKQGAASLWGNEQCIKTGGARGKPLILTTDEAVQWGLARRQVDDLDGLYALYGINGAQVRVAEPDRLDDLAEFLRQPLMRIIVVMLGIACLILELKMPGVSVPGVIAAICFILFFWSHSQTAGLDLLGILLFILGLVLIGLEIFVIPGFGIIGISGIALVVISLALVAFEKRPQTTDEWIGFLKIMGQFSLGLVGGVGAAITLASYLPYIPYVNRLVLHPETEEQALAGDAPSTLARPELAAFLGAIGVAATPLRPAGKVKFGDEYLDVLAEGGYVSPGSRVQVVEIEGNRMVVKEVQ